MPSVAAQRNSFKPCAWACLLLASTAGAVDLAKVAPVAEVHDQAISVGARTLVLPPLTWRLVGYDKGRYNSDYGNTTRHTGYLASIDKGQLVAAVVLEMGETPLPFRFWNGDPCGAAGSVHKSMLSTTPLLPECLIINRVEGLHLGATGALYRQAVDWYTKQGIEPNVRLIDVTYRHYGGTGQGLVRVFLPATSFASEQAAVDWAKALPETLKPMLAGRVDSVTLPDWRTAMPASAPTK